MTNKNISCRTKPFLLSPIGKDYLWGGSRLNDDFSKDIPMEPLAESWECSVHPDGGSVVASGEYTGKLLSEVLKKHPEYLGTHPQATNGGELPILIKLIDAKKDLSIQVHPDDAYAKEHEHGSLGKTEMWYVLDADKDTHLVYGLLLISTKTNFWTAFQTAQLKSIYRKYLFIKMMCFLLNQEPYTL